MLIPVRQPIQRGARHCRVGFTLIEVLVALFVMGVATTILVSMYTSSLTLAQSSKTHTLAAQVAQEYMNELRIHPQLFDWPDFNNPASSPEGLHPINLHDGEHPILQVSPSSAIASSERAFQRDKNLYRGFNWYAYGRLNEASDNYVEVMVQVHWFDGQKERDLCFTSLVPRSIGEGVGR